MTVEVVTNNVIINENGATMVALHTRTRVLIVLSLYPTEYEYW